MKKTNLFFFALIILAFSGTKAQVSSDTNSMIYLMNKAAVAYQKGDYPVSEQYYNKVLLLDKNNYDARFGLAMNLYRQEEYDKAIEYFKALYRENPRNTDVLNGLARSYSKKELYDDALPLVKQSIQISNNDASLYFDLAFLYIVKNKLDSASYAYGQVLRIDSTYAEAWAGIGKIYYWQDKPRSALKYYKMAQRLDPEDIEIKNKLKAVRSELEYTVSGTFQYITEDEPSYHIGAVIQKYGLEKRITDRLSLGAYTMWDYSHRDNLYFDDVNRWYDNTWIKPTIILGNHRISLYAGVSINDQRITSYGTTWNMAYNIKNFKIRNYLTAAYDYFYYWNKVGQNFLQNTLVLSWKGIILGGTYRYGVIRNNYVWDYIEKTDNPNTRYNIELKYQFLKNPKITLGVNYLGMDYKYSSPLYYSPSGRTILGGFFSEYVSYKKFYQYLEFAYGRDNFKTDQYNGSLEFGINIKKTSVSLGGSYFYNKYYKSLNTMLSVKQSF